MYRIRISKLVFTFACVILRSSFLQGQTGLEVMQKNNKQQTAQSESVKLTMILINKNGKQRTRSVQRYQVTDQKDNRSSLILFLYPADVKGTGYLEIEHSDKDNDGWLYLPALQRSRRISTADESDNFMSSEFTYEDLNNEDLDDYLYTLKGSKVMDGVDCFHILAEPATEKKKKNSGYSKRELYIAKDNYTVKNIDYYDHTGALAKQFSAENYKEISNTGKWRADKVTMKNVKSKASTVLEFEGYVLDEGIDSEIFTTRYLENNN